MLLFKERLRREASPLAPEGECSGAHSGIEGRYAEKKRRSETLSVLGLQVITNEPWERCT